MSSTRTCLARPRLVLALAIALSAPAAWAQENISKVNGGISVEAGRHVGDVETVNGIIRIADEARIGNAEAVNGGITLGNRVTAGALETVNGGITLGDAVTARRLSTVNGAIRGGRDTRIDASVETVSGSVYLDRGSQVGAGLTTVNGGIGLVGTTVAGDVETVSGDITVGANSRVRGDLSVRKPSSNWFPVSINKRRPRIVIGPSATVDGDLVFEREVSLYVHESASIGRVTGAEAQRYSGDRAPRD